MRTSYYIVVAYVFTTRFKIPPDSVLIQECFQHSLSEGGSTVKQAENLVFVDLLMNIFRLVNNEKTQTTLNVTRTLENKPLQKI